MNPIASLTSSDSSAVLNPDALSAKATEAEARPKPVWEQHLGLVESKMLNVCAGPEDKDIFSHALRHHLGSGGGRNRSRVVLSTSSALGLNRDDAVAMAASVELLHNASLVQDDLQDQAQTRRGQPTVWSKFGTNAALGLTDLLITGSFAAAADISNPNALAPIIKKLHYAVAHTLYGQAYDVGQYGSERLSHQICLEVARAKAGPLFALSLELPLIAAARSEFLSSAQAAAHAFGMGYQIIDDIADRDEDQRQGALANMLLALEMDHHRHEALRLAADKAREYLNQAASIGKQLPNQCGYLLVDLTRQLQSNLEELTHA